MRIMIHTIPERFGNAIDMEAELVTGGFPKDDIFVYIDRDLKGPLPAFLCSIDWLDRRILDPYEDIWHLQDDVELSKNFVSEIAKCCFLESADVVCGFASNADIIKPGAKGWEAFDMHHSFPCIRIRSWVLSEFARWLKRKEKEEDTWVTSKIRTGKYDDTLFRRFIYENNLNGSNKPITYKNLIHSLVDHRGDIYGSVANPAREDPLRAINFLDEAESEE